MKAWIPVLLLALAGIALAPRAQAQTAAEMAADCAPYRHALRLAPASGGGSTVEAPGGNAKSDFCWGAFATWQGLGNLQQAALIQLYLSARPAEKICIPLATERLQLVKTFLQYMDHHPEMGKADFNVAVLAVMLQSYPCARSGG